MKHNQPGLAHTWMVRKCMSTIMEDTQIQCEGHLPPYGELPQKDEAEGIISSQYPLVSKKCSSLNNLL
jgi:hypothetical protein